jgi:glycine oxidase
VNRTTQVVVVGAGVIGCAVAYELARRGARVRLLDRRDVARGATQASAGILAPFVEAHEGSALIELGGRSLERYDEFVARVVEDSSAAVQYARNGTLEVAFDRSSLGRLDAFGRSLAARGVSAECLDGRAVREAEPQLHENACGGVLVHSHGLVGARDLTAALRRAAAAHGVSFEMGITVARITSVPNGLRVETPGDRIECDTVVMAAGSWSGQIKVEGEHALPVRPVRGQLLSLSWSASPLARVVWSERCYLAPWTDGTVLAGATIEDVGFDERATVAGVRELIEAASAVTPQVRDSWFQGVRVGLRPATPDHFPIIGASTRVPGLVYATGHFRSGVLLAPLTAELVADLVLDGVRDPALDHTAPERFETDDVAPGARTRS